MEIDTMNCFIKKTAVAFCCALHGQLLFSPPSAPVRSASPSSRPVSSASRPSQVRFNKDFLAEQMVAENKAYLNETSVQSEFRDPVAQSKPVILEDRVFLEEQMKRPETNSGIRTGVNEVLFDRSFLDMKLVEGVPQSSSVSRPVSDAFSFSGQVAPKPMDIAPRLDSFVERVDFFEQPHIDQQKLLDVSYNNKVEVGVDRYKKSTPDELRASINTAALGNARTVLVDTNASAGKRADAVDAIYDIRSKIDAAGSFVHDAGRQAYQRLHDSVEIFSSVAQDAMPRILGQARDQAFETLMVQRENLAQVYRDSLNLLKSVATKEQSFKAKNAVQAKISSKNSAKIFKDTRIEDNYDQFIKDLVKLEEGVLDQQQLAPWLETKLNLKSGELSSPPISVQASIKLEGLYQALDLIAIKKGSNVTGSLEQAGTFVNRMRGSRLSHSTQIVNLMNGIKKIEPLVKTTYEDQLLKNSTDKQSILLITQSDFMYTTLGRGMKELAAIEYSSGE